MFQEFSTWRRKGWGGWKRRRGQWILLKPLTNLFEEPTDTELTELTRILGDQATAKRVRKLQLEYSNGPSSGTVPELVTMDWLNVNKYHYIYQGQLYGGRARGGGLLPDFVVDTGGGNGMVWNVQGDYWHNRNASKQFSDAAENLRYIGQIVGGIRITNVILLNESDILSKRRDQVFQMALAGISL